MKSNQVSVTIVGNIPPPEIIYVELSVSKTVADVNEPVTFYVSGEFENTPSEIQADNYRFLVKVYVNGMEQKRFYADFQEGSPEFTFSFILKFMEPGNYSVQVDVSVVPR